MWRGLPWASPVLRADQGLALLPAKPRAMPGLLLEIPAVLHAGIVHLFPLQLRAERTVLSGRGSRLCRQRCCLRGDRRRARELCDRLQRRPVLRRILLLVRAGTEVDESLPRFQLLPGGHGRPRTDHGGRDLGRDQTGEVARGGARPHSRAALFWELAQLTIVRGGSANVTFAVALASPPRPL